MQTLFEQTLPPEQSEVDIQHPDIEVYEHWLPEQSFVVHIFPPEQSEAELQQLLIALC